VYFVRDKKVVGVFVRFRAPLQWVPLVICSTSWQHPGTAS
jgi:hypothetical protein